MLVDSSVWISFLRGDTTAEVALLVKALERAEPVWLAPPILQEVLQGADSPERFARWDRILDRKSTRLNSSHSQISYAVFCLKKKRSLSRRRLRNSPICNSRSSRTLLPHQRATRPEHQD